MNSRRFAISQHFGILGDSKRGKRISGLFLSLVTCFSIASDKGKVRNLNSRCFAILRDSGDSGDSDDSDDSRGFRDSGNVFWSPSKEPLKKHPGILPQGTHHFTISQ